MNRRLVSNVPLNRSHGQRAQIKPGQSRARAFISIIITICHPAVPVTLRSICSLRATNCIPFFTLSINLLHITNTLHYPPNTSPNSPWHPFTFECMTPDRAISVNNLFMGGISVNKQVSFLAGNPAGPSGSPDCTVLLGYGWRFFRL